MQERVVKFPTNFLWGAATAAYQIEGGYNEDGRGMSIWDTFCHTPGLSESGDVGDIACDHYHRFKEDVRIMQDIGLKSYRFSISWPRVSPDGIHVNIKGLDFYDKLVNELLKANILPMATLYHWDLPQALDDKGGWLNKDMATYFGDFTSTIVKKLGDRVKNWITFNEMIFVATLGYGNGLQAPGRKCDKRTVNQVKHNLLLAHGNGVLSAKSQFNDLKLGVAHSPIGFIPGNSDTIPYLVELTHKKNADLFDPIFFGEYPDFLIDEWGSNAPSYTQDELKFINQPIDFLGLNIYAGAIVETKDKGKSFQEIKPEDDSRTTMGWPITPECLYWIPKILNELYQPNELYITENGISLEESLDKNNKIHDSTRIQYIKKHIIQLHRAIDDGVPMRGYYVWSFMDNLEWSLGFSKTFGLVYVDTQNTLKRTLKDSAYWYRTIIKNNECPLD